MKKFNNKGISLIEVIGAIAIIIIGVVTVVSLLYYTINTANVASKKNQAHYLAQEAVEAARRMRDNNWLAEESGQSIEWYDGFKYVPDNQYAFLDIEPAQNEDIFFYKSDIEDLCSGRSCKRIYKFGPFYTNIEGVVSGSLNETQFNRYVEFYQVCEGDDIADASDCGNQYGTDQIGIQIKVHVDFNKGDRAHNYDLEERIYDWKY